VQARLIVSRVVRVSNALFPLGPGPDSRCSEIVLITAGISAIRRRACELMRCGPGSQCKNVINVDEAFRRGSARSLQE